MLTKAFFLLNLAVSTEKKIKLLWHYVGMNKKSGTKETEGRSLPECLDFQGFG